MENVIPFRRKQTTGEQSTSFDELPPEVQDFREQEVERTHDFFTNDDGLGAQERSDVSDAIGIIRTLDTSAGETLRMRQELVGDMTATEARQLLNNSTRADWVKDPTYWRVVADRADSAAYRLRAVTDASLRLLHKIDEVQEANEEDASGEPPTRPLRLV